MDSSTARESILCVAIRERRVVEFDYGGHHRVVAPYCHGVSTRGGEVLRGVQIGGTTSSGGFGFGKLWTVSKMENQRDTAMWQEKIESTS